METYKLPETGFLRLKQILQFIPVGETTWRVGVREGVFPNPVKIGDRVNLWRVQDIKDLIESYSPKNKDDTNLRPPYGTKLEQRKPYEQLEFNFNNTNKDNYNE
jgi:prophage regulatory protein